MAKRKNIPIKEAYDFRRAEDQRVPLKFYPCDPPLELRRLWVDDPAVCHWRGRQ